MSGPSAGWFDPIDAVFKAPSYGVKHGEPSNSVPVDFFKGPIRFPRNQFGREQIIQNQTVSTNSVFIRVRRNRITEQITAEMTIHHRGKVYGIIAPYTADYLTDELEFVCQVNP